MNPNRAMIFGPVPSRRLGRSLGINNIPPKICSYSCLYCQVGRTTRLTIDRQEFFRPEEILAAVQAKLEESAQAGEPVDYLSFVPDGEPTLDINLDRTIALLRPLKIPIAVITNTSLIWQKGVRHALSQADWVSLKVDSVEERIWRKIDRPHRHLKLATLLDGAAAFAGEFPGKLVTETMLLAGINDTDPGLGRTARFLATLRPATAYLSVPTRPPAEKWARPANEQQVNRAFQLIQQGVAHAEYLTGYEGNAFAATGNLQEDILNITAVHPMRQDAVAAFLEQAGAEWPVIDQLIREGELAETEYAGHRFYLRKFSTETER
jgi:wyosine [tRNA(Phe)-imidazoG37] synthetase (radical SAM superfamily)